MDLSWCTSELAHVVPQDNDRWVDKPKEEEEGEGAKQEELVAA